MSVNGLQKQKALEGTNRIFRRVTEEKETRRVLKGCHKILRGVSRKLRGSRNRVEKLNDVSRGFRDGESAKGIFLKVARRVHFKGILVEVVLE